MKPPEAQSPLAVTASLLVVVAFGGSVLTWMAIAWRVARRLPVVRHEPRRHVPWRGVDVLILALAYVFIGGVVMTVFHHFYDQKPQATVTGDGPRVAAGEPLRAEMENEKTAHPLMPLFSSKSDALIALGIFLAVVKAPLIEEFIFRVILQGWLESVWVRSRRRPLERAALAAQVGEDSWEVIDEMKNNPYASPRSRSGGVGSPAYPAWLSSLCWLHQYKIGRFFPVLLPALVFAMLHFRWESAQVRTPSQVAGSFVAAAVAEALWLVAALCILVGLRGATARDLGWSFHRLGYDVALGLAAVLAIVPPVLLLSGLLEGALRFYKIPIAGDPLPIFLLALALGFVYRRTHRITPSLVLHMGLNGSSVLLFYLQTVMQK